MNPLKPTITVPVGGVERPLRYEFRDWATAEAKLGKGLIFGPEAAEFFSRGTIAERNSVLLWIGLLHDWPNLTLEEARGLITFDNFDEIDVKLAEALRAYVPQFRRAMDGNQPAPFVTPGTAGGLSGP